MKSRNTAPESASEQVQCWGENPNAQMVRLEKGDGSFILYPYGTLESVQFSPTDNEDKLTLVFGEREINIRGKGLRKLGLGFQRMSVEWIKELPNRFKAFGSEESTIVSAIEAVSKEKDRKTLRNS